MTAPKPTQPALDADRARLRDLIQKKALTVKTDGAFSLASGGSTTYFFDMKLVSLDPEGAALIGKLMLAKVREAGCGQVGGLETGAIPLVTAIARESFPAAPIAAFFVKKEAKGRGTNKLIEGNFIPGQNAAVVEDVTTRGESALQAVRAARAAGAAVTQVVTLVDRLEGAADNLRKDGIELVPIFTRDDFKVA